MMEDCLEMVDALNALLSPGERELCDELMSSCEETSDFRCFHCPTRCDIEVDMIRHCDQAHPYYEAKYHVPASFAPTQLTSPVTTPAIGARAPPAPAQPQPPLPSSSSSMTDHCRWMCCACSTLARSCHEMEVHCTTYHRNGTSRHWFIDRTNLLKMSFTDRSLLHQPPLAPTPPQDSSDILFHDLASSAEGELEKLNCQATQMAVMALTNTSGLHAASGGAAFTTLPPISSLLHPQPTSLTAQDSYAHHPEVYYGSGTTGVTLSYQAASLDGETSDLGSSPSGSTYEGGSPMDFNQYSQTADRYLCPSYALPKYSAMLGDIESFASTRHAVVHDMDDISMSDNGRCCYGGEATSSNTSSSTSQTDTHSGAASTEMRKCFSAILPPSASAAVEQTLQNDTSKPVQRRASTKRAPRTSRAKTAAQRRQPDSTNLTNKQTHSGRGSANPSTSCSSDNGSGGGSGTSGPSRSRGGSRDMPDAGLQGVLLTDHAAKGRNSARGLLKLAGPLSAKQRRVRTALPSIAAPASVKSRLETLNIELHLSVLPPISSGSSRSVGDHELLLEDHLKSHERAFIHIAGCKLKVRDYASVVDIHPMVQLTDVLRATPK